jgi:hypothetical protein
LIVLDQIPVLKRSVETDFVKAGSAVPVKFSLSGYQGLDILFPGYPASAQITCNTSVAMDQIEQTVTAGRDRAASRMMPPATSTLHLENRQGMGGNLPPVNTEGWHEPFGELWVHKVRPENRETWDKPGPLKRSSGLSGVFPPPEYRRNRDHSDKQVTGIGAAVTPPRLPMHQLDRR